MSNIAIQGAATGTGVFTLASPATNTDRTLVLPDEAGTVLTSAGVPASAMPAGSVLQVVSTAFNPGSTTTTSTTYVNSGLSLGITLSSASNKVLMLFNGGHSYVGGFPDGMIETICRQSSTTYASENDLSGPATFGMTQVYNSTNLNTAPHSIHYLDTTPGSTTPTYRIFFRARSASVVYWQEGASQVSFTLMEIAA
jgi:hypothetical protein